MICANVREPLYFSDVSHVLWFVLRAYSLVSFFFSPLRRSGTVAEPGVEVNTLLISLTISVVYA